ncbi:MAG: GTP pyrophosphokinase [Planctomycetota bacterium]|jgi:(p)ppGpp synthase/HD superfamily hydrolase
MATLEKAIILAANAHLGQKDKAGAPYILHPLRVMLRMRRQTEMLVAVLHDVVEDTSWTLDALRKEGFPEEVLMVLDCLTRKNGESYDGYIERVKNIPVARRVKLADLEDNMNISRISNLTERDIDRLKKYHRFWLELARGETT